jgi:hypothetical protein
MSANGMAIAFGYCADNKSRAESAIPADEKIQGAHFGWPGIRSPGAKDYLFKHQITAEGWFVANPEFSFAEIERQNHISQAVDVGQDWIAER